MLAPMPGLRFERLVLLVALALLLAWRVKPCSSLRIMLVPFT